MTVRLETCPPQPVRFHEYANLFPMMQGDALDALREDIRRNGVREPIVMLSGAILDGRNRYMCARDLGMQYPVREFDEAEPLAFVVSANLARRHLSESQRASIGARIANLGQGRPADKPANLPVFPGLGSAPTPVSQADAARMLNVSARSVRAAKQLQDDAPELVPLVDAGAISVSLAQRVADLPMEDVAAVLAAPIEESREIAREVVKRAHVANNSGNNEWYTPTEFIEAARRVLGEIDLDPASSPIANRTVRAARFFTAEDDGLRHEWPIGRIFMNPPYGTPLIGKFAERFAAEVKRGSAGIALVNNATETAWFQSIAVECSALCFPRSRVKFLDMDGNPSGAPLQGQAIFYCGPNPTSFIAEFRGFGLVLTQGSTTGLVAA